MSIRVASFNISFSRPQAGDLYRALCANEASLRHCAAILRRVRPDIVLLNEFDHDGEGRDSHPLTYFCTHYLQAQQADEERDDVERDTHSSEECSSEEWDTHSLAGEPLVYPYRYLLPTNTGLLAPVDLDGDGQVSLPGDGLGFGTFHGKYGMALLSRFPLLSEQIRSLRGFLWRDMPGAKLPIGADGVSPYYSSEALAVLRLSSKNHLLLPVQIGERTLQLLLSHPVPPVFDGPERRNRCRNHDEIRLWADLLDGADYLKDEAGIPVTLPASASFVLLGDLNADPQAGDGDRRAIQRLLAHPRVNQQASLGKWVPRSRGALEHAAKGRRRASEGIAEVQAASWTHLRGLRLDYVLPSADLVVSNSGVFWPGRDEPGRELIADPAYPQRPEQASWSSDHRLVWVDIEI